MTKTQNISRPFGAWAINYKNSPFQKAKIKLAFFYTFIVLVILSAGLLLGTFWDMFVIKNRHFLDSIGVVDESTLDSFEKTLEYFLGGFIVILTAIASYFFAKKTLSPVERAYESQKRFVADTSHELKTPLSVMKIGLEYALGEKFNQVTYKKYIRDTIEEVDSLTHMINELLLLSELDRSFVFDKSKINFSKLVESQVSRLKLLADKNDVTIHTSISANLYIDGNEQYLRRLIVNLVTNAIIYNKKLGKVDVSLVADKDSSQHMVLRVSDTGVGISQEDQKHILERFYKSDKSRAKNGSGSGLGLSIADEIIKKHNGKILITSQEGKGTDVKVRLPIGDPSGIWTHDFLDENQVS